MQLHVIKNKIQKNLQLKNLRVESLFSSLLK